MKFTLWVEYMQSKRLYVLIADIFMSAPSIVIK